MTVESLPLPEVSTSAFFEQTLDVGDMEAQERIRNVIGGTGWAEDTKANVVQGLGLEEPRVGVKEFASKHWLTATASANYYLLGWMRIWSKMSEGGLANTLSNAEGAAEKFPLLHQYAYLPIEEATRFIASIAKAPTSGEPSILFSAFGIFSAALLLGAGAKSGVEKFQFSKLTKSLQTRSAVERETMIEDGNLPVDLVGHLLGFGVTDSSMAQPLLSILKDHSEAVVPVHRGEENAYPSANEEGIWVSAGPDKSIKTTMEMAELPLLLQANSIDASVILVNCMRQISAYRSLDASVISRLPKGTLPPQTAETIFENTWRLTSLAYGDDAPSKAYIAIVSRHTTVGEINVDGKSDLIPAKSLFTEKGDRPTAVIEPEELVEEAVASYIDSKEDYFEDGVKAHLVVPGEEKQDEMAKDNLVEGLGVDVSEDLDKANVVIMMTQEDQEAASLVGVYREKLDQMGKNDVPIIVIGKTPDKWELSSLGEIEYIAVQGLIAKRVDEILGETIKEGEVSKPVRKEAKKRLKLRQKGRLVAAKV
ncbi:hypothetical protein ACFL18_02310 [Patescibacteria group bacterium]